MDAVLSVSHTDSAITGLIWKQEAVQLRTVKNNTQIFSRVTLQWHLQYKY